MKNGFVSRVGITIALIVIGLSVVGCASAPLTKKGFSNEPVQVVDTVNTDSSKTGTLTERVYLGFIGTRTYPSIADTAKAGGITRIKTVEYYYQKGVFNIWTDYTTIVTGN